MIPIGNRPPSSADELAELTARLDAFFADQQEHNPAVEVAERAKDRDVERRWYVRLLGEEKATFAVWFELGQRALHYETYVMPAPEENEAAFYAHLLRRNSEMFGASFTIGAEDAVFLSGRLANNTIDDIELDRVLGSLFLYVEQFFRPALRIGFASRLAESP